MNKKEKILEDQAWARMEGILEKEMPVANDRKRRFLWWIGLCALVAVSIFALAYIGRFTDENSVARVGEKQVLVDKAIVNKKPLYNTQEQETENDKNDTVESEDKYVNSIKGSDEFHSNNRQKKYEVKENNIFSDLNKSPSEIGNDNALDFNASAKLDYLSQGETYPENKLLSKSKMIGNTLPISREEIKNRIMDSYTDGSLYKKNFESIVKNESEKYIEEAVDRVIVGGINKIPTSIRGLLLETEEIQFNEVELIDLHNVDGDWWFGGFASYQYTDQFFQGFDLGMLVEYNLYRFGIGLKVGYERVENAKDQVLADAKVGVYISDLNSMLELAGGDIFNTSQNAGFELQDIVLQRSNLLVELAASYQLNSKLSMTSGIGMKRLLSVSTRPINGLNLDSQDLEPTILNVLDGDQIITNPFTSRNRFYIPCEVNYSTFGNSNLSLGIQLFVNKYFNQFDDKNRSIYVRWAVKF